MMSIENINDHMAFACECGSTKFCLLKSGRIECAACLTRQKARWNEKTEPADTPCHVPIYEIRQALDALADKSAFIRESRTLTPEKKAHDLALIDGWADKINDWLNDLSPQIGKSNTEQEKT